MTILIAKILSFLSNPVIISLPVPYLIVYKSSGNAAYALKWELFSIIFIVAIVCFVFYGITKGFFSDFDISKRQERTSFFIFTGLITVLYFLSVILLKGPNILLIAVLIFILGIIIMDFINRYLKASIHVATNTAFFISMSILYGGSFVFGLIFIPIIAWARVVTKRHTTLEAVVGGILGAFLTISVYVVVKYIL